MTGPTATGAARQTAGDVLRMPIAGTDAALLGALRSSHADAPRQLVERYGSLVRRVLGRVLGPDPEINDLLQDVFVTALSSLDKVKHPHLLSNWLTGIAVFKARAKIRRRVRWRFLHFLPQEEIPEQEGPSRSEEASEALRVTYRILGGLPADERIAFSLRFIDGMELTEVADACAVSLATIKRRLRRAQDHFVEQARQEPCLGEWIGRSRWTE